MSNVIVTTLTWHIQCFKWKKLLIFLCGLICLCTLIGPTSSLWWLRSLCWQHDFYSNGYVIWICLQHGFYSNGYVIWICLQHGFYSTFMWSELVCSIASHASLFDVNMLAAWLLFQWLSDLLHHGFSCRLIWQDSHGYMMKVYCV